ncbi:TolC family protein [bacterium]|nr:TolC family protein [bacterium]
MPRFHLRLVLGFSLLALFSCSRVIHPAGEAAERERAARAGAIFEKPADKRPLPDLSESAPLPQALEYAFNANGEIEAAWREWRAAIERVPQAGALADPRLSFSFLFDAANLGSFGGALNSIRLMLDQEIPGKGKRPAKAQQALAEAQSAGEKFRAAKYGLQRRVVQAYADLALNRRLVELTSETLRLLNESYNVALHRYHEGGMAPLGDLRKLEVEIARAQNEQQSLIIQQRGLEAALNGVLNRPATDPVGKVEIQDVADPQGSDAELLERAARSNPDLAALRRDIEARGAAQVLAELQRRPDYSIGGGLDNPLMPIVTLGMTLPINTERIQAGINEALQMRAAAEARLRTTQSDTQARLMVALATLRENQRAIDNYTRSIIPRTRELLDTQLTTYGSGGGEVLDVLDTQRMLIELRKMVPRARADRMRASAEIEQIVGDDIYHYMPAQP